ncbi:hypothetical protein [Nocardia sp. NBC_01327]|uniref:hypothetical protein n=1 Tax=Nocardia sp. NBC_01327 TaxID=2903593 RepID=UPI002E10F305|nr:hypothetical protein OG326_22190 [Nocardia sp. NBC_01327]
MRKAIGDAGAVLAGLVIGCLIIIGAIWVLVHWMERAAAGEAAAPTITADEARDRMDTLLRHAVATMGPEVSLTQTKVEVTGAECNYGWQGGDGPTGEVEVSLSYLLGGVTPDTQAGVISAMGMVGPTHHEGDYFQTVADPDRSGSYQYVFTLKYEPDHQMSIHAYHDCLWEHGTPEPLPRLGTTN